MALQPTTVFAAPVYNSATLIADTLDSLLAQTDPDFALVLVDDASTDESGAIARRYSSADERVSYSRNEARRGLLENTRRAYELARALHPGASYFAYASDHDLWHADWLRLLREQLDGDSGLVLACPVTERILDSGERGPTRSSLDTSDCLDPLDRLRATLGHGLNAGNMIYGLFRAEGLDRIGTYRRALAPDKLLLSELALHGRFKVVPRALWARRFVGAGTTKRRRGALFGDRRPVHSRLPWWLVHGEVLLRRYAVEARGRPAIGRVEGARAALMYMRAGASIEARKRIRRARWRLRRARSAESTGRPGARK